MNQKIKLGIVLVIILITAIAAIILLRTKNQVEAPVNSNDIELNQSTELDSTTSINQRLDQIDLSDTTEEDIKIIDAELMNL